MKLKDHVVLITGAAGSLGYAVSAAFILAGARIVAVDVNLQRLHALFPGADPNQLLIEADLMNADSASNAVQRAIAHYGRLDAVVNVAGGFTMGPLVHETSSSTWSQMMDLNAGTMLNVVRAAVPHMLTAGHGSIVSVAAVGGVSGRPNMAPYSVSKSAVIRITEAMSAELREKHINVNCVLPSIIDTPANRSAMPDADPSRWVTPADLASVMVFLCSDAARAIHGAAIPVVGLS